MIGGTLNAHATKPPVAKANTTTTPTKMRTHTRFMIQHLFDNMIELYQA
jgi:hypothetical protein